MRGWAGRPEYGNSLLVKSLEATDVERLDLGLGRSCASGMVRLPGGSRVLVAVTHLHHVVDGDAERDAQAAAFLDWLGGAPAADAVVAMGATSTRIPTSRRMRG